MSATKRGAKRTPAATRGGSPPPPASRCPRRHSTEISPAAKKSVITSKQRRFCDSFVELRCPTKAAGEAGYKNPSRDGKRLMDSDVVKRHLAELIVDEPDSSTALLQAAKDDDRITTLKMLRNSLAQSIENRKVGATGKAQMSKELRETMAEIDDLEKAQSAGKGTMLDGIFKKRDADGLPRAKTQGRA